MLYMFEFEICQAKESLIAIPFDFLGGTEGKDEKEVAEMAADWLKMELETHLMKGVDIPGATFGNEPKEGGRILLVAIEASLETIDAVQATEAAKRLGVSRGRVTQMVNTNLLDGFRKGRDAFVTVDSINARLKDTPRPGRPRKETAAAK